MLRNGTRVPRGGFAAVKIFAEEGVGLRNLFHSGGPFSQGVILGCEISQTIEISWF